MKYATPVLACSASNAWPTTTLATSCGVSERDSAEVIHCSRTRWPVGSDRLFAAAFKPPRIAQGGRSRRVEWTAGRDRCAKPAGSALILDLAAEANGDVGGPVVLGQGARDVDREQRRLRLP